MLPDNPEHLARRTVVKNVFTGILDAAVVLVAEDTFQVGQDAADLGDASAHADDVGRQDGHPKAQRRFKPGHRGRVLGSISSPPKRALNFSASARAAKQKASRQPSSK